MSTVRKSMRFMSYGLLAFWFGLMIARPVMEYLGTDRAWRDAASRIAAYSYLVLIAAGIVSAALYLTPKYRERRRQFVEQYEVSKLPASERYASIAVMVLSMLALAVVNTSVVADHRTQKLIEGVGPFVLMLAYLAWFLRRAKKLAAERKANKPDDIFS